MTRIKGQDGNAVGKYNIWRQRTPPRFYYTRKHCPIATCFYKKGRTSAQNSYSQPVQSSLQACPPADASAERDAPASSGSASRGEDEGEGTINDQVIDGLFGIVD